MSRVRRFRLTNLFEDERGDIFPLFSNVKRIYKSYRVGADFNVRGFKLTVLRRWEYFDDYTPYSAAPRPASTLPIELR